jgi:membrane fusion protein, copper/silver efflux system
LKSNSLLIIISFLMILGCEQKEKATSYDHAKSEEYTCSMHPQVVRNTPGTCPICGMELVKKAGNLQSNRLTPGLDPLLKPTNANSISSIKTVTPIRKTMVSKLNGNGLITYDTRQSYTIPVRFSGRVEKLYIRYNFQPVKKGQKILEAYSPDLVEAQRELLFLMSDDKNKSQII